MNTNKILSADLLDLVFEDRNKEYGAYELRKTYPERIKKALFITIGVSAVIFTTIAFAGSGKQEEEDRYKIKAIELAKAPEDEPEPLPPPVELPEPEPVQTEQFTPPQIVDDNLVEEPPPAQTELEDARIGLADVEGVADVGIVTDAIVAASGGIIEENTHKETGPYTTVQVQAKFIGNWEKYLLRNLRGEVPAENGAPAGRHKVVIQFVVDVDGKISDIKAMTHVGFGMEEEAIRVIKKSDKWEPAIQNGFQVKAYRQQPITFEVNEE